MEVRTVGALNRLENGDVGNSYVQVRSLLLPPTLGLGQIGKATGSEPVDFRFES